MLIKSEFSEELATVIFFRLKSIEKYFEFEQLFVDKKTRHHVLADSSLPVSFSTVVYDLSVLTLPVLTTCIA